MEVVLPAPLTPATMITVGLKRPITSGILQRRQQLGEGLDQQTLDGGRIGDVAVFDAAFQVLQQMLGGLDAGVGHQQGRFQVFVQRVVNLRAGEHGGNAGAGFAQAGLELVDPALALGRSWCRQPESQWALPARCQSAGASATVAGSAARCRGTGRPGRLAGQLGPADGAGVGGTNFFLKKLNILWVVVSLHSMKHQAALLKPSVSLAIGLWLPCLQWASCPPPLLDLRQPVAAAQALSSGAAVHAGQRHDADRQARPPRAHRRAHAVGARGLDGRGRWHLGRGPCAGAHDVQGHAHRAGGRVFAPRGRAGRARKRLHQP